MNTLTIVIALPFALVAVFGIFVIFFGVKKEAMINKYEWLSEMSHVEWRSGQELLRSLAQTKKLSEHQRRFLQRTMYGDLGSLEDEELVEGRRFYRTPPCIEIPESEKSDTDEIAVRKYRITENGRRRRLEVGTQELDSSALGISPSF
jgi:hypothetical protein